MATRWVGRAARLGFLALAGLLLALPSAAEDTPLVVGSLVDLSGPTAVLGEPYARGVKAFAEHLNGTGGVGGRPLELMQIDCGGDPVRAIEAYGDLRGRDGLVAILGWGSQDTVPLADQVRADRLPFFLSAAPRRYADPGRHPYHFPTVPDYATLLQAGLKHLREGWQEARPPRVAFLFPPTPFGSDPVRASKAYAVELGFQQVAELEVAFGGETASLAGLPALAPDFVWCGGTAAEAAAQIRVIRGLGLQVQYLCNLWAGEGLVDLAGTAAEGVLVVGPTALPGDGGEGWAELTRLLGGSTPTPSLVRGWVTMGVVAEALSRANGAGQLTAGGVKSAAESLSRAGTGGLAAPVTYTATDHRPYLTARIHQVSAGGLVPVATVSLERHADWLEDTASQPAPSGSGGQAAPTLGANPEGG